MVLNEPQAQTASASENAFISECISTAKALTSKPVSVRFMGGYSPSTGHYSSSIDSEVDFLCRNVYWDPRDPSTSVYGTTEAKMETLFTTATSLGKELWITEFGKVNTGGDEAQRAYIEGFVTYARTKPAITRVFGWACKPTTAGAETYDLFNGYTPRTGFLELKNASYTKSPVNMGSTKMSAVYPQWPS